MKNQYQFRHILRQVAISVYLLASAVVTVATSGYMDEKQITANYQVQASCSNPEMNVDVKITTVVESLFCHSKEGCSAMDQVRSFPNKIPQYIRDAVFVTGKGDAYPDPEIGLKIKRLEERLTYQGNLLALLTPQVQPANAQPNLTSLPAETRNCKVVAQGWEKSTEPQSANYALFQVGRLESWVYECYDTQTQARCEYKISELPDMPLAYDSY